MNKAINKITIDKKLILEETFFLPKEPYNIKKQQIVKLYSQAK